MNNTSTNSNNCSSILLAIKEEKLKARTEAEQSQGNSFELASCYLFSFNSKTVCDSFQDSDFVNINPRDNVFWTILFTNYFLCSDTHNDNSLTHDDLVFFVSKLDAEEVKK
jgi:hypothetical protein